MGSHDHQFSPELRAAIRTCALLAKREVDDRESHNSQARQIRQMLDSGIRLVHRVNHLAYWLSQLRTTRRYCRLARQNIASIRRLSEELNFTLTALNDMHTTFIQDIKGHNIQLLAHLLCYTGDDKAAAETLLTIGEKYHALYQEWKQRLEGLDELLGSYRAAVAGIT
jgi:hypothetical protein